MEEHVEDKYYCSSTDKTQGQEHFLTSEITPPFSDDMSSFGFKNGKLVGHAYLDGAMVALN